MKRKLTEEEKKIKREKIKNIVGMVVLACFVIPIFFLIFRIINTPADTYVGSEMRTRSDYVLMLLQCILGIVALTIPNIILERKNIEIPTNFYIIYILFLYCAIFLGEIRGLYNTVPYWDTILHTFSGGMLGALGFSFVSVFNKSENIHLTLSPFFVAFFAFTFAVTLGVLWEIYEFIFDGLFGINMQRFMTQPDKVMLVGRDALVDTMKDLIVDTLGALVISILGFISLKHKKGWVEALQIKIKRKK